MKKPPYHFVALTADEKKLLCQEYLRNLPTIIKSLELQPDLFDSFLSQYEQIKELDRKNTRIGITGQREDKQVFYNEIDQAIQQVQESFKSRTKQELPKQAVFWMAGQKLMHRHTVLAN